MEEKAASMEESAPLPTSMVTHVVSSSAVPESKETPRADEPQKKDEQEPVIKAEAEEAVEPEKESAVVQEQWKKDAFEDMNKNTAVHNVVPTESTKPEEAKEEAKTFKVVMIRHGESEWNKENRFCGWFDAGLSPQGKCFCRTWCN